jgi:hypothetical protein
MKKSAQMSKTLATKISMSLLIYGASMMPFVGVQAEQLDKRAILAQAGQAYYSLRGEGLESFQCDITPNWANLLKREQTKSPQRRRSHQISQSAAFHRDAGGGRQRKV